MTEVPNINNAPDLSEVEYGPIMVDVNRLVEIFKESGGRSETFESSFIFWRKRMEESADEIKVGPERTLARLRIIISEAEMFLRIWDIPSANKAIEDIWMVVGNDPAFEYDETSREVVGLYEDIDFLHQMLESATKK